MLAALHVAAAQKYQDERLLLSEAEQAALRAAVNNAARHYSIPVTQKAMDTGALFIALFRIEAPRIAIVMGKSVPGTQDAPQQAAVVSFPQAYSPAAE